jgi:hypothetical protein
MSETSQEVGAMTPRRTFMLLLVLSVFTPSASGHPQYNAVTIGDASASTYCFVPA